MVGKVCEGLCVSNYVPSGLRSPIWHCVGLRQLIKCDWSSKHVGILADTTSERVAKYVAGQTLQNILRRTIKCLQMWFTAWSPSTSSENRPNDEAYTLRVHIVWLSPQAITTYYSSNLIPRAIYLTEAFDIPGMTGENSEWLEISLQQPNSARFLLLRNTYTHI